MSEENSDKMSGISGIMEKALIYLNPELYMREKEYTEKGKKTVDMPVNNELDAIRAYGRKTGRMPEHSVIARAVAYVNNKHKSVSKPALENAEDIEIG